MAGRSCVMGCKYEIGQNIHHFPKDAKRRAEWCRILGVYPRAKRVHICSAHFSDCYLFGNRTTKFAMPNPPESRKSNPQIMTMVNSSMLNREPNYHIKESLVVGFPENEKVINENEEIGRHLAEELLHTNDSHFTLDDRNEKGESQETAGNVEDFEIRKSSTNDMIIKGRYVQTNDYLVVSYTPPRKWSLQQQVQLLDEKCEQQLKIIQQLNKENYRLFLELKKHDKLLPKLRFLRTHNRFLYVQLKRYKQKEKELRKRAKEKTLSRQNLIKMKTNDVEK